MEREICYMDKGMMKKLITTMIKPKLEYAEVVRSPHTKKHRRKLVRILGMTTTTTKKMVP